MDTIKLLIDIPKQMYLNAKADILCGGDILVKAIKNGIPHESVTEFADRCRECGKMRKGHWIAIDEEPHEDYECDRCGYIASTWCEYIKPSDEYNYCPNCGCRMVEPQESENNE